LGLLATRVDERIAQVLDDDNKRWVALDAGLADPLDSLRAIVLSGGKRLRPAFCHWAFVGMGGDPEDPAIIDAGAALELLHTFALIHDDVMDGSTRRHGVETIHEEFAGRHRRAGWRGDADRFGTGVAILAGDLAFVYSGMLLTGAPRAAIEVWNDLRLEVNVGQYLDLDGTARDNASAERARRICVYKSGKYTIERPLHLGAALACPERLGQVINELSDYGLPLGEAFQLRDDQLGAFGDPEVTGKPVGEDLREGKPTLLYALARREATPAQTRLLDERFGRPDLTEPEVLAIQEIFDSTGARASVENVIDGLVDRALGAADRLPLEAGATTALVDLAHFVTRRDH
ncbi:MAG: polyprenyl synthetase family protein, partial [Acidimicrobiales bacterium]